MSRKIVRTQDCSSVVEAQAHRTSVFSEFSRILKRLHDADTPLTEVRDLNDKANKLLKTRRAWEYRIRELGGPDYTTTGASQAPDSVAVDGIRFFGRAIDLPDVVQLLQSRQEGKRADWDQQKSQRLLNTEVKRFDAIVFDDFYYGDLSDDAKGCSSNVIKFNEDVETSQIDPKRIEEVVVELKKKELYAKLEAKRQKVGNENAN